MRKNVSVKLSYDEGGTWPVQKTLEPGFSGYSDLAVTRDGTILCFYERGSTDGENVYKTGSLTVARFNLEWLTDGKDRRSIIGKRQRIIDDVAAGRAGKECGGPAPVISVERRR